MRTLFDLHLGQTLSTTGRLGSTGTLYSWPQRRHFKDSSIFSAYPVRFSGSNYHSYSTAVEFSTAGTSSEASTFLVCSISSLVTF